VPSNLGKQPTCDAEASTDGSAVCPTGCDESAGCSGTATVHYELSSSCPGSTTEPCTPTNIDRSAGCCDKNIRTYHTTTREAVGEPTALTSWTTYDPRTRPWYTEQVARTADSGWSSVCASITIPPPNPYLALSRLMILWCGQMSSVLQGNLGSPAQQR
jgi:hypothetical protein